MNNEEMLFELKPCNECSYTCVEGQVGVKCPFDVMVENLIKVNEDEWTEQGIPTKLITVTYNNETIEVYE